jgi:hypothetical protein
MNTIKKSLKSTLFLLILLWGLIAQSVNAAEIKVSVDRNPVILDESFQILFTSNESPDGIPDFSALNRNFSILNQSQSSNSSWVNGKSRKSIQWTLSVIAKKAGTLVIPAIAFGQDISDPLTIEVTKNDDKKAANTIEDLFLDVEVTPLTPYLQSQVLYTLRLYRKVEIAQAQLTEPALPDAVVAKLDNDRVYETQVKGVDYSVTERKYVIFPQKSGLLTIKPLILTAEVVMNSRHSFNGFFNSTQTKRVVSKEIILDVKPAPATFTGSQWLSAEQLELRQEWSGDFDQMKIGEPLTRTLTIQARGATVSSLPELNGKMDDNIKAYPDQPVLKEQKTDNGLIALREEKIALIPSKSGSYTLPAIEIPWFNTLTDKMEVANIPETTISVLAGAETPAVSNADATSQTKQQAESAVQVATEQSTSNWLWVSLFLALGWLITVFYFLTKRPVQLPVTVNSEAELSLKANIQLLKRACADNNAIAAKNALLAWGLTKFSANSLGVIADCCDARLRDEVLQLNQVLYGKESAQWSGKKLFQAFAENKARAKMTTAGDEGLEPLFRL